MKWEYVLLSFRSLFFPVKKTGEKFNDILRSKVKSYECNVYY